MRFVAGFVANTARAALCVLILTSCASVPSLPPPVFGDPIVLSQQFKGRFSANIETLNAAHESVSRENVPGRFDYSATAQRSLLELYSPFGQLMARFTSPSKGDVTLETADRGVYTAKTADELADTALGWRVPITRLPQWLRGNAGPNGQTDIDGRLLTDVDANWRVTVEEWSAQRQPLRMTLRWPENRLGLAAHKAVQLKLIVEANSP
jgi:outer membrane biogenesis lipoprotein LolB